MDIYISIIIYIYQMNKILYIAKDIPDNQYKELLKNVIKQIYCLYIPKIKKVINLLICSTG